jgi:hypothetical protein
VLEFSHSRDRGDEAAALGIDDLGTVGFGVKLDSSKYPFRYTLSTYASGPSIGSAVSF